MLRTLAERVSRGLVFRRRLPARFGRTQIFVSPDAGLRFWRYNLETADSDLFDWATEFVDKGDVVWDIGANVGLFAFAAAARAGEAGHVYAVEADLWLASLLRRSAALSGRGRAPVEVIPLAVSDKVGLSRFQIAARGRCTNFLEEAGANKHAGGTRETGWVPTVTLDWLLERLPAPHVVKIDVEGAEHLVLKGADRLMADARPLIICEVQNEQERVRNLFARHNYQLFNAALPAARRQPVGESPLNDEVSNASGPGSHRGPVTELPFNVLARPK